MQQFLALTVVGVATYGCVYALTALGLVVTYKTSGIFNFAQGAMGMIGAFLYWQFAVDFGWPSWLSFILVALVLMPLAGAAIERLLMRRMTYASLESKITVTIGLLLFLLALANTIWSPAIARTIPEFFSGDQISIGGVVLTYDQLIVVTVSVLVAAGLPAFFYLTRTGIAMRAVVDDRDLTSLTGAVPSRYSMFGWALGAALASTAGILLAPTINLDITTLTLLVINGYAAAMVGRLRSLPLTFLGAIVLGLLQSYAIGYLPIGTFWTSVGLIIPMIYLFVAILLVPQTRASISRHVRARAPKVASLRESLVTSGIFLVLAVIASLVFSSSTVSYLDLGVALALVLLSMVLLTGYGGQVSLCQLTFAGLGAYAMGKVGGTGGSLLGVLAAVGLAAAVGTLVALPALRLRGLYLAIATLAFAYAMDNAFFSNTAVFGPNDSLDVARPELPWISLTSNKTFFVVECVVFAAAGVGVLALRRSSFGRRVMAITDSPAASLTLGVDITGSKLLLFTISAGLAGLGGALYGGSQGSIGPDDFAFLASLTILLMAVVWGIRTIGGMLVGGMLMALGPVLQEHLSQPRDVVQLLVGLAAIGVSMNPEGTFGSNTPLQKWRDRQARQAGAAPLLVDSVLPETVEEGASHAAH